MRDVRTRDLQFILEQLRDFGASGEGWQRQYANVLFKHYPAITADKWVDLLTAASMAHHTYEVATFTGTYNKTDPHWPEWYAAYIKVAGSYPGVAQS